jgi:hypothetical protein
MQMFYEKLVLSTLALSLSVSVLAVPNRIQASDPGLSVTVSLENKTNNLFNTPGVSGTIKPPTDNVTLASKIINPGTTGRWTHTLTKPCNYTIVGQAASSVITYGFDKLGLCQFELDVMCKPVPYQSNQFAWQITNYNSWCNGGTGLNLQATGSNAWVVTQ